MAIGTGYTTGIRSELNKKGISDDRITYDKSKGVMIDGASFYKPEKVYNGSSFTSANNFNTAWDNYSKGLNQNNTAAMGNTAGTTPIATTGATGGSTGYSYDPYANNSMIKSNPYTSQTDQLIQSLMNYGQNQGNFDPYSSSAYKAAEAQAGRSAQQNTRAAQEAYGSAGFGRSTGLGERVAGINNDATEYLMTQVLPQIEAQEAARRQQEYNNQLSILQQLVGRENRADTLVQNDVSNRLAEGQLTGNYLNPEATAIIDQLMGLKQQAEAPGLANANVKALSGQADVLRNRLAALGIDPALFGANVNATTAGQNRGVASRTIQGQQLDINKAANEKAANWQAFMDIVNQTGNLGQGPQANWGNLISQAGTGQNTLAGDQAQFEQGITMAQLTGKLPDGTPTTAEQQRQLENLWIVAQQTGTIPNPLADLYGLPRGTRTQDAIIQAGQLAISQQNANTSAGNLALSRDEFDYRQEQDALDRESAAGGPGGEITAKQSADNYNLLLDDIASGVDKATARQLLQANQGYLTDSDYKKLNDYINNNL